MKLHREHGAAAALGKRAHAGGEQRDRCRGQHAAQSDSCRATARIQKKALIQDEDSASSKSERSEIDSTAPMG
jgi:hypothetical protein